MIDRKDASRDELIRRVVAQRETIPHQQRVIVAHQERDGTGHGQGMPGLKPVTGTERPSSGGRKRRAQQFVRRRREPTRPMIHARDLCPQCGGPRGAGRVKRRREVIEVPVVPAVVTQPVLLERCCPHGRTRHTPGVDLAGEVVGNG